MTLETRNIPCLYLVLTKILFVVAATRRLLTAMAQRAGVSHEDHGNSLLTTSSLLLVC